MSRQLSVTQRLVIAELHKRGYECRPMDSLSPKVFLEFTDGQGRRRYINGAVGDKTNAVACRIVDDKLATTSIAQQLGLRAPDTVCYESIEQAQEFIGRHGTVVVKPLDSAHGNGVTVQVDSPEKLAQAVSRAQQFCEVVLLQQQVGGQDMRLLYIGGEFCAAAERRPAAVIGDGQHTIHELIELENEKPERGQNYQTKYNVIPLATAAVYLGDRITGVPAAGELVQVIGTANIGSGGVAVDRTEEVPEGLIAQGKRLVDELALGVCGVDFLDGPEGSYIIEANASPSFGLHHYPHEGAPHDVTAAFVDWILETEA